MASFKEQCNGKAKRKNAVNDAITSEVWCGSAMK